MASRLQLSEELHQLTENVYFQEPNNTTMKFPCIVYERARTETKHADNIAYNLTKQYAVTVIDSDPDSLIVEAMLRFPMSRHTTHFVVEGRHHDVFDLFF